MLLSSAWLVRSVRFLAPQYVEVSIVIGTSYFAFWVSELIIGSSAVLSVVVMGLYMNGDCRAAKSPENRGADSLTDCSERAVSTLRSAQELDIAAGPALYARVLRDGRSHPEYRHLPHRWPEAGGAPRRRLDAQSLHCWERVAMDDYMVTLQRVLTLFHPFSLARAVPMFGSLRLTRGALQHLSHHPLCARHRHLPSLPPAA